MDRPHVVIIGGGGTGAATAHDLTQRGCRVSLFERGELTSGTTGRHHGQLHSGARYAVADREIARECMEEVRILQRIAAPSLEMNYGMFIALTDEDVAFAPEFRAACEAAGIPTRAIDAREALAIEPQINTAVREAVIVPDGTIDAFRLPLQFFAAARAGGATIRPFHEVIAVEHHDGTVTGVVVRDRVTGAESCVGADAVVSATGAWAGQVAARAGLDLPVTPAPGTMVAVGRRLTNMIVSHLHRAGDGDIIVSQRKLSIIGSTQWQTDDPDHVVVPEGDVPYLLERAAQLVPAMGDAPFHAAWAASRPLAGRATTDADGRALSRDLAVFDHGTDPSPIAGFFSVVGGKATVLRAMAEVTSDIVCRFLGVDVPCRTADTPLPEHRAFYRRTATPIATPTAHEGGTT